MKLKHTKNILYTTSIVVLTTLLMGSSVFGAYEWRTIGGGKFVDGSVTNSAVYTAGNVGIGTLAPDAKLDIANNLGVNTYAWRTFTGDNWSSLISELGTGGFNGMSVAGDQGIIFSNDSDANVSAGGFVIAPHAATTSGLRIMESGNVGIGTADPSESLDVVGNIQSGKASGGVALTVNDGGGNANVTFNHANQTPEQTGNAGRIHVNTDSTSGGTMAFELADNKTGGVASGISDVLQLYTGGNMRTYGTIQDSSGDTIRDANGGWVRTYGTTGWYNQTYAGGWYMIDSTWVRSYSNKNIYTTSQMRAGSFTYSSDRNLKTNIRPLLNGNDILKVKAKRFDWTEESVYEGKKDDVGIIAQDVEKYFPHLVTTDADTGYKAVDYPKLVIPLLDVVQKQQKDIESLEQEIADIKALLK